MMFQKKVTDCVSGPHKVIDSCYRVDLSRLTLLFLPTHLSEARPVIVPPVCDFNFTKVCLQA